MERSNTTRTRSGFADNASTRKITVAGMLGFELRHLRWRLILGVLSGVSGGNISGQIIHICELLHSFFLESLLAFSS